MKYRHSLRVRIIFSYCLFGAAVSLVFATAVYLSLDFIDDTLIDHRLAQEIEHIGGQSRLQAGFPLPTSPHIKAYIGTASMPQEARELVVGATYGFQEVHRGPKEYHIAVVASPDSREPMYLLYDVSTLEFTEKRKIQIRMVLAGGVLAVIVLGFLIGRLTARRVIAPVVHLAEVVGCAGPDSLPTDLSSAFYRDEVGTLAGAFEEAMGRVRRLVNREKQFTRDASHELRTPVTVIKGAVEILKRQPLCRERSVMRPLKRIERSVANMEHIIEAFLWLAREDADDAGQECDLENAVRSAVLQLEPLFEEKPVQLVCSAESSEKVQAPAAIVQTVIVNLIKNAFHHTSDGRITVHACRDRVTVSDTGTGIAACDLPRVTVPYVRGKDSSGHGLGLAIVQRLCDRFGWHLAIDSQIDKGTVAHLFFHPPADAAHPQ
jgi:signal transduction histidine kinase